MSQPRRLRALKVACVQTRQRKPFSFGSNVHPGHRGISSERASIGSGSGRPTARAYPARDPDAAAGARCRSDLAGRLAGLLYRPLQSRTVAAGFSSRTGRGMAKSLPCWFGRHQWTPRVEQRQRFMVCAACGKEPRGPRGERPPPGASDVEAAPDKPCGGKTQGDRRWPKRVRCYLGWHTWQRIRNDEGKWYMKCRACGKFHDIPVGPIAGGGGFSAF